MRIERGNYTIILAVSIPVLFGFAALGFDVGLMVIGHAQSQFAADAAAHAAYVKYRVEQDESLGRAAADALLAENRVVGAPPDIDRLRFGRYLGQTFIAGGDTINAVSIDVSRAGDNAMDLAFARVIGFQDYEIAGSATVSGRKREVVIVQDVTGSFIDDIAYAEAGDIAFLDFLIADQFPGDRIGMSVFQRDVPAAMPTPLTSVENFGYDIRAEWEGLAEQHGQEWLWPFAISWCTTLSKHPGVDSCPADPSVVPLGTERNGYSEGEQWLRDNGYMQCRNAVNNCMNRDQTLGTRPGVGLEQAIDHLIAEGSDDAFKAIILVSDGLPNTYEDEIEVEDEVDRAWANDIHVWTVTYENGAGNYDWMSTLARGIGTGYQTPDPSELDEIMVEIAASIPVVLVE